MYFDQLSGAARNWKKLKYFYMFFSDFSREITEKGLKWTKKVEKAWKKIILSD